MLKHIFFGSVFLFLVPMVLSGENEKEETFTGGEISVTFAGGFEVKPAKPVVETKGYFENYQQQIGFCPQPELPPYVQQVSSGDGWLCRFYILPPRSLSSLVETIKERPANEPHLSLRNLKMKKIKSHRVLRWRYQRGKTRLDHYLLAGKKNNYLFVSSPYGDWQTIEKIIETVKFK